MHYWQAHAQVREPMRTGSVVSCAVCAGNIVTVSAGDIAVAVSCRMENMLASYSKERAGRHDVGAGTRGSV